MGIHVLVTPTDVHQQLLSRINMYDTNSKYGVARIIQSTPKQHQSDIRSSVTSWENSFYITEGAVTGTSLISVPLQVNRFHDEWGDNKVTLPREASEHACHQFAMCVHISARISAIPVNSVSHQAVISKYSCLLFWRTVRLLSLFLPQHVVIDAHFLEAW